jgi:5-methylcytosine-specific restriction protein A
MPTAAPRHRPSGHQTRQQFDQQRSAQHSRDYDSAWRKLSKAFRAANPLCTMCMAEGIIVAAEVVDHIVTIRDDPARRLDTTNLRSLCKRHHDQRTMRDLNAGQRA